MLSPPGSESEMEEKRESFYFTSHVTNEKALGSGSQVTLERKLSHCDGLNYFPGIGVHAL